MILLLLTAIDQQGEVRNFACYLPKLETGFDLLTAIAYQGDTLINARVLQESSWTQLPVEAFDENPVSPAIKQLEKEWQQAFHEPLDLGSDSTSPTENQ